MYAAGVDIGAATAKAVILNDDGILTSAVIPTGDSVAKAGEKVIGVALDQARLTMNDLDFVVSTGYGRRAVPCAGKTVTEIICHAAGASFLMPQARTIIDIGGQDSMVIGLDDNRSVANFVMNDKCAAGTGRFLEVMAGVLNVEIAEMGGISLKGKEPCQVSSTCTVFAETEMISLRAEGVSKENLLAGIHRALAHRVVIMGAQVRFRKDIVFTGGVAKNMGIKKALEDEIGIEILVPEEPQIIGAFGAAILAKKSSTKGAITENS